jgi:hypothetical protein
MSNGLGGPHGGKYVFGSRTQLEADWEGISVDDPRTGDIEATELDIAEL